MRLATPDPPDERGVHGSRPFWLWLPRSEPPWPGMVILHGAGSAKENHADFGRVCAANGWAAVTYDQRGHGESEDLMAPAALADVSRMASMLAAVEGVDGHCICVRGSSMGGYLAIHAAATASVIAGAIAICPASEEGLRQGLREGRFEMRADLGALDAWLGEHDLQQAVGEIAPKPLMLMHARGDEKVPYTRSEDLYALSGDPRRILVVPGGSHRSVQHDPELQVTALKWIARELGRG